MNAAIIFSTFVANYVFAVSAGLACLVLGLPFAPVFVTCHKKMRTNPERKTRSIVTMSVIGVALLMLVAKSVSLMIDMNLAQPIYHECLSMLVDILTGVV